MPFGLLLRQRRTCEPAMGLQLLLHRLHTSNMLPIAKDVSPGSPALLGVTERAAGRPERCQSP
jgi:hypothetical protein